MIGEAAILHGVGIIEEQSGYIVLNSKTYILERER